MLPDKKNEHRQENCYVHPLLMPGNVGPLVYVRLVRTENILVNVSLNEAPMNDLLIGDRSPTNIPNSQPCILDWILIFLTVSYLLILNIHWTNGIVSTISRICSACQHKNKQLCQLQQFQVLYKSYNTWSKKHLNVENKLKCEKIN